MLDHTTRRVRSRLFHVVAMACLAALLSAGVAAARVGGSEACATRLAEGPEPSFGEGFYDLRAAGVSCAAARAAIRSGKLATDGAFHSRTFDCVSRSAPFHFLWFEAFMPSFPGFRYSCRSASRAARRFSFGWNGIHQCPALTSHPSAPTFEQNRAFSRYMTCLAIDTALRRAAVKPGPLSIPTLSVPGFSCVETLALATEDAVCVSPAYSVQPTKQIFGVAIAV